MCWSARKSLQNTKHQKAYSQTFKWTTSLVMTSSRDSSQSRKKRRAGSYPWSPKTMIMKLSRENGKILSISLYSRNEIAMSSLWLVLIVTMRMTISRLLRERLYQTLIDNNWRTTALIKAKKWKSSVSTKSFNCTKIEKDRRIQLRTTIRFRQQQAAAMLRHLKFKIQILMQASQSPKSCKWGSSRSCMMISYAIWSTCMT